MIPRVRILIAVLLLVAAGAAQSVPPRSQGAETLPPVPGAQVTDLTQVGFFNEPSVAINPNNPQQVVVAYQIGATAAFSSDAGASWASVKTAPQEFRVSGDPSIAFDAQGHAILCYIAFDKLGTTNYWAHNATRNGVFIKRSLDGGKSWEGRAIAVISHPSDPGIPFEDKPYLVADTQPRSPHRGNLYVGWTRFTLDKSVILFSRSINGGLTWSEPIKIDSVDGLPRDDNGAVEGFTGAVAADGTLYVVWAGDNRIDFTFSRDGGKTFVPSRGIVPTAPPQFNVSETSRANGFPQIAIDPRGKGTLFITWSDYRNGDVDIFASTSRDQGHSWSPPVRVNNDPLHNGADQFFQWLAVDPSDGTAYVIFYDRRGDPQNKKTLVVLARSTDSGQTFTNYAWTQQPFVGKDDFLGDYTGLAALNGRVYGAWAEEGPEPSKAEPDKKNVEEETGEEDETRSVRHRTLLRVGVADFNSKK